MNNDTLIVSLNVGEFKEIIRSSTRDIIEEAELVPEKHILRMKDCVRLTGFKPATIYKYVAEDKIPFWKKNKQLFFDRGEIEKWIKEELPRLPKQK